MRKLLIIATLASALTLVGAPIASAGSLPDNCTKTQGTVTCTEGPGQNQGGVGTSDETQGNTTNKSPEPQSLDCTKKPPKAQGGAIGDCPA
jgi:hypothetical protein